MFADNAVDQARPNRISTKKRRTPKASTVAREAFFLEFAEQVRARYPDIPLLVTGGCRSRAGMERALRNGSCDMVGLGRSAAVAPGLPKVLLLNVEVDDEHARINLQRGRTLQVMDLMPIRMIGFSAETLYYKRHVQLLGAAATNVR